MAAQIGAKNAENDWDQDDEDENWDDWGDAEENYEAIECIKSNTEKTTTKTTDTNIEEKTINSINNFKNEEIKEVQASKKHEDQQETRSSWDIWGSKFTSAFSTATEGLGSITTTVSQGLSQVIGVPDPEELARINACEIKQKQNTFLSEEQEDEMTSTHNVNVSVPVFGLSLVSGVTTLGTKVLNTGLDTLEGIGKKTMDLLQENDPLLKNKRKLLGIETDKPNLSEILKEAKKDAETIENSLKELKLEKSKAALRFDLLFENYCGLVHLEALEILSKESKLKLQTLIDAVSGNALNELQVTLHEVKELTELDELESESDGDYDANKLNERLITAIADAELPIKFEDIANIWTESLSWFDKESAEADDQAAFAQGITALAETCAIEISKLHKIAELLLIKEHHSTANEVDAIVQLCKQFNAHLSGLTTRFAAVLTERSSAEAKSHVTTLFSELLLAMQHIDKAFKLFLPILQIGAV